MMRLLIALHATLPAALVAAMLLHLWPPAGLPPLAARPGWASWALIGLWLSFSIAALPLHGARLWRSALAATGALLAVAGVSGVMLGMPLAIAMGVSQALLGAVCAALTASSGSALVHRQRPVEAPPDHASPEKENPDQFDPGKARPSQAGPGKTDAGQAHQSQAHQSQAHPSQAHPSQAHPSQAHPSQAHPSQAHPSQVHPSQARPSQARPCGVHPPKVIPITVARTRAANMARAWRLWIAAQARHAPFWLTGGLAVESFRLAHVVATGAARPSGMLGLLLACLIALPAATLNNWLPRASTALWLLAALGYAGLCIKSGLLQWGLASVLCAFAACCGPWLRRTWQTRHHGSST